MEPSIINPKYPPQKINLNKMIKSIENNELKELNLFDNSIIWLFISFSYFQLR